MRMFLIAMTDIFLILYLTTITKVPSTSILTVEDFFQLKTMHETLQIKQKKTEEDLQNQLRLTQEEKDALAAKLTEEHVRTEEMEESLIISDAELARINEDLQMKENMLKEREQLLENLNQKIEDKEATWRKVETSYKEELENQKESLESHRMLAEKLQLESQKAQRLANQMQKEADQAYEIAEQAKAVQQNAILLKDEALKEKEDAEQKARTALEARKKAEEEKERADQKARTALEDRKKAEEEKEKAIKAAEEEKKIKEQLEKKAEKLTDTIKDITQDGETAYQSNVRPQMQQVSVTFERTVNDITAFYERKLILMPIKVNGKIIVIFPSQHIGFTRRSDKAPQNLVIMYKEQKLARYWINKNDDLIAVELPSYVGKASTPYPADTEIAQFMPALLALRNNGNKGLADLIRGLSDEYFIVNRDYIQPDAKGGLSYNMKGLRGTGMRGERIIRGDQLVDLNGRLIGVAKDANRIIRIDTLNGWEERAF